jgi:capsular exopolysaccharide synthesis family protein
MSRIHDALRRAELERASQAAKADVKELAGLITDTIPSDVVDKRNSDLPVLPNRESEVRGVLSFEALAKRCAHPGWRIDPQMSVFEGGETGNAGAERFRTLRSRLYQVARTKQFRRVLITSSAPAEGKSFVAANLAQSFAGGRDCRVLLIDADMRLSRLHVALGAPNIPGLTNYLRGETDEISVIQIDAQKGFGFIPAGDAVADPSELILGGRMKNLLDLVTPAFDWVILDSPPALAVHDASLLADLCDGVLFVVKAGETSDGDAVKASSEFQGKNLLGVVLNQVEEADLYEDYYYSGENGGEKK